MRLVSLLLGLASLVPLSAFATNPTRAQLQILGELYGWGQGTTGGGEQAAIYEVTTNADSGQGSLRAALESPDPLWIVFAISDTIKLKTPIRVKSNKTVDARGRRVVIDTITTTYPNGPCPSKDNNHGDNVTGFVIADQTNIILLNLIFDDDFKPLHVDCEGSDAITITDSSKIWIHHCTFKRWADGAVDILSEKKMSTDVTVSWSLFEDIFQPLLWKTKHASFHHNICRDDGLRCPDAEKMNAQNPARVHSYNNYIKNWRNNGVMIADASQMWDDHNMLEPDQKHDAYKLDNDGCIERNGGKNVGEVNYPSKKCTISSQFKEDSNKLSPDKSKCDDSECWKTLKTRLNEGDGDHRPAGASLRTMPGS